MYTYRLQIRLNPETDRKLSEIAEMSGGAKSDVIRALIDEGTSNTCGSD